MLQRFSSREAARNEAREKRRAARLAYSPKGAAWASVEHALRIIAQPIATWTYRAPDVPQGTMVLLYQWADRKDDYSVLAQHEGKWYLDFPKPPYLLYQRYEWTQAETVYICAGEKVADLVESLGLAATATLGGMVKAALSDFSPLQGKQVIFLPYFDVEAGLHAGEVAQQSLGAGALSARILTLPDRKPGEGLAEWISERIRQFGSERTKNLLKKIASDATPVVYVKPLDKPPKGPRADLQCLSEVVPEPLEWVFDGVIPRGRLTLLTGEPGVGKSLIVLELAARVTRGARSPHAEGEQVPGAVILFSAEGGVSDTIRPRLEASGADLSRVYALCGVREIDDETGDDLAWSFQLECDLPIIEAELQRLNANGISVRLIVIDPMDCYLGAGDGEAKANADSVATRLVELAERTGVAIVMVLQTSRRGFKATGQSRRQRAAANGAFSAAARSIWMVAQDQDDPQLRLLLPVKTNLCETGPGLAYSVHDGIVQWKADSIAATADEYLQTVAERTKQASLCEDRSELTRVADWLRDLLTGKRIHSLSIFDDARANLISIKTLRRALGRLNGQSKKEGESGKWYWSLPGEESPGDFEAGSEGMTDQTRTLAQSVRVQKSRVKGQGKVTSSRPAKNGVAQLERADAQ